MHNRRGYILVWTLQGLLLVIAALVVLAELRLMNCHHKRLVSQRLLAHYLAEGTCRESHDIPAKGDEATLQDLGTLNTDLQRLFAGKRKLLLPPMVISRQLTTCSGVKVIRCKVSFSERQRVCFSAYHLPMVP